MSRGAVRAPPALSFDRLCPTCRVVWQLGRRRLTCRPPQVVLHPAHQASAVGQPRGGLTVASGTLGANELIPLPAGDYVVRIDSAPPRELPVELVAEENLTMVLERSGETLSRAERRRPADYRVCEEPLPARASRLTPAGAAQPAAAAGLTE